MAVSFGNNDSMVSRGIRETQDSFAAVRENSSTGVNTDTSLVAQGNQATQDAFAQSFENSREKFDPRNSGVAQGNRAIEQDFSNALESARDKQDPDNSAVSQGIAAGELKGREGRGDFTRTIDRGPQVDADIKLTKTTSPFARIPDEANKAAPDLNDPVTRGAQKRFFSRNRDDPTANSFRKAVFGRHQGVSNVSRAAQSRPRITRPTSEASRQRLSEQERQFDSLNRDDREDFSFGT